MYLICCFITFYTYLKTDSYISEAKKDNASPLPLSCKDVKPTDKGNVGDKEMTLSEVKSLFLTLNNYKGEGEGSDKEFCLLANGFWQAEGYIGGIFRSGLNFYPICSATQLFSVEVAKFFIRLDKALCNRGTFSITLNSFGKFVIVYRLSGWDTLFYTFVPYFHMLYGDKYRSIFKLKKIYQLKDHIKHNSSDDKAKVLLVSLVYSLTAHSPRYKVSLEEKLRSLNLNLGMLKELPLPEVLYKDNEIKPSFFIYIRVFFRRWYFTLKIGVKGEK